MTPTDTQNQKQFALSLLEFHGGQNSGLYAVGSCMLADSECSVKYNPANHRGHAENAETCGAVKRAIFELRGLNEKRAEKLANRLEKLLK